MENPQSKQIFLLIDGLAIIHRAYHSMPNFTTKDGRPTGAVYGFNSMLLKLIQNIHPSFIAVAFDRSAPTFRQELFADYHANRPKAPDDLRAQFGEVRDVLATIGIPVYEVDGYEGDDMIGTINANLNADHKDMIVYIVTGDRDMLQLVDVDTHVIMPVKGISEVMLYDSARVMEKFGVRPDQIIDLKAFTGDPSDNYPGVTGVGPKTAMNLLQKYEHFEAVFDHITEIEKDNPKLAQKLKDGAEQAFLAKKLATIHTQAPVDFQLDDCAISKFPKENFVKAYQEYEFGSLVKRLDEVFGKGETNKSQMKLL